MSELLCLIGEETDGQRGGEGRRGAPEAGDPADTRRDGHG